MVTAGWREPSDEEHTPTGLTIAGGVVVVVVAASVAAVLTDAVGARVGALAVAVLLFTALAGDGRAAVGVAVVAWAVGNGFLINQRGQLSWRPSVDTWFVMGLLGAVAVGMIFAEVRGWTRRRRRWRPLREFFEAAVVPVGGSDVALPEPSPGSRPESAGGSADAAPGQVPR